ncbi:MAG: hypothetical protein WEB13_10825 [Dehalococcoidia bacterium]
MRRLFQWHVLTVIAGLVIGLAAGALLLDTQPPVLGWLFGAGAGVIGGTFIAAIASGEQIVSGPAPPGSGRRRTPSPEELDELERELPHLLDDLPAREAEDG